MIDGDQRDNDCDGLVDEEDCLDDTGDLSITTQWSIAD